MDLDLMLHYVLYILIGFLLLYIAKTLYEQLILGPRVVEPYVKPRDPKQVFLPRDALHQYDGSIATNRIYVGINGTLYDVTRNKASYGPGAGYNVLTGRDASRALATMDLSGENKENYSVDDLAEDQLQTLSDWEDTFRAKYRVAGKIVDDPMERAKLVAQEDIRYQAETEALAKAEEAKSK